jgi:hypothetical protein
MDILGNIFVRKAIKSMMTPEQFAAVERIMTAVQSGKIDKALAVKVASKFEKFDDADINKLLKLIDKNF